MKLLINEEFDICGDECDQGVLSQCAVYHRYCSIDNVVTILQQKITLGEIDMNVLMQEFNIGGLTVLRFAPLGGYGCDFTMELNTKALL